MCRRLVSLVVAVVALFSIIVGRAPAAHAVCSCTATTAEQGMSDSAVVFLGSLTDITPSVTDPTLVDLTFDVQLVYKGDVAAQATLTTFASPEDCGIGTTARRGDWLIFGYAIPGGDQSRPLVSTCSPSALVTTNSKLPIEIGEGRAPPGAKTDAPVATAPEYPILVGEVTDPRDTFQTIAQGAALLVVVGVVARLLAGRRRAVVR